MEKPESRARRSGWRSVIVSPPGIDQGRYQWHSDIMVTSVGLFSVGRGIRYKLPSRLAPRLKAWMLQLTSPKVSSNPKGICWDKTDLRLTSSPLSTSKFCILRVCCLNGSICRQSLPSQLGKPGISSVLWEDSFPILLCFLHLDIKALSFPSSSIQEKHKHTCDGSTIRGFFHTIHGNCPCSPLLSCALSL